MQDIENHSRNTKGKSIRKVLIPTIKSKTYYVNKDFKAAWQNI